MYTMVWNNLVYKLGLSIETISNFCLENDKSRLLYSTLVSNTIFGMILHTINVGFRWQLTSPHGDAPTNPVSVTVFNVIADFKSGNNGSMRRRTFGFYSLCKRHTGSRPTESTGRFLDGLVSLKAAIVVAAVVFNFTTNFHV